MSSPRQKTPHRPQAYPPPSFITILANLFRKPLAREQPRPLPRHVRHPFPISPLRDQARRGARQAHPTSPKGIHALRGERSQAAPRHET